VKRIISGLFIALLTLSACATTDVKTTPDGKSATGGGGAKSATIGQPVTIKGNDSGSKIQVTAKKVVLQNVKPTDGFSTVDPGKRLVAVRFLIVNTGTAPYDDAPSNGAKVVNAAGEQFDADITMSETTAGKGFPAQTKLAPGNKALGFLVFSVPAKAKITQVQFSQDSGFGDTAQWNIK